MKHRNLISSSVTLIACSMAASTAHAKGGIDTEYANVHITGGAAGGYYAANREVKRQNDQNRLSDFLLGIHTQTEDEKVGLSAGIGYLPGYSLFDRGSIDSSQASIDLQYATLDIHPADKLTLEVGRISSNVGYENTQSFLNTHSVGSIQGTAQPGYFEGTRFNYGDDVLSIYVEQSDDSYFSPVDGATTSASAHASTGQAWATGAMGEISGINYAISYHSYVGVKSMIDLILGYKIANMDIAFSYDRHTLTDAALGGSGKINHAESAVFYVSGPTFDKITVPVRLEAFDDHDNEIYGNTGKGHSVTMTPTWNFTDNAYIRTDFSYLKLKNKILADGSNTADNRFMFVLQAGYRL